MYCMNDGTCSADGLSCQCPSGFFGLHCQNSERCVADTVQQSLAARANCPEQLWHMEASLHDSWF